MKLIVVSRANKAFKILNITSQFFFFIAKDLKMCRKPNWFQCSLTHGPCLSSDLVCNGIENCPCGDDEVDCVDRQRGGGDSSSVDFGIGGWHLEHRNCSQYEFTCLSDRSCIPLNFMCDGKTDCHDGSDESAGCLKAQAECTGFFCDNKRCLESKKWVCDGTADCNDGSDEKNCGKYHLNNSFALKRHTLGTILVEAKTMYFGLNILFST